MKKNGVLNSEISKVLADLGHTDQIVIADCGLPIPENVKKIDLALELGTPKFIEVLKILLKEMEIEQAVLAEEIKEENSDLNHYIKNKTQEKMNIKYISHEDFKLQTRKAKAIIRTGEATPYANIILQAGVIF